MYQQVREFHDKFKFPVSEEPNPRSELIRLHHILEETSELALAYAREEREKFLDGAADLLYVIIGTAVQFGYDLDEGPSLTSHRWQPPGIVVRGMINQIGEYVGHGELCEHIVQCMFNTVLDMCLRLDIPYEQVFSIVHESNMSKIRIEGQQHPAKGEGYIAPNFDSIDWAHP